MGIAERTGSPIMAPDAFFYDTIEGRGPESEEFGRPLCPCNALHKFAPAHLEEYGWKVTGSRRCSCGCSCECPRSWRVAPAIRPRLCSTHGTCGALCFCGSRPRRARPNIPLPPLQVRPAGPLHYGVEGRASTVARVADGESRRGHCPCSASPSPDGGAWSCTIPARPRIPTSPAPQPPKNQAPLPRRL